MITMDNASNNDTLMAQLEVYMTNRGLDFDRHGNRLRCVFAYSIDAYRHSQNYIDAFLML
jgi:hypothetical protein